MIETFETMRAASRTEIHTPLHVRKDRLSRLHAILAKYDEQLVQCISDDFGYRVPDETRWLDILPMVLAIKYAKTRVRRWMRPKAKFVHPVHLPARSLVVPQPLGVVGVISPWNFPLTLSVGVLVDALAAGNRVMLKLSELTPKTSNLLKQAFDEFFDEDEVVVILGGPDVSAEFATLPFDHLVFTGSTEIGRKVAAAAAPNLTPVTLELGGKSPAIIAPDADLKHAAASVAIARLLNAGQACVSSDYVLIPRDKMDSFARLVLAEMQKRYPSIEDNLTSILADKYLDRQKGMIAELEGKVEILQYGEDDDKTRKLAPRVVINPPKDSKLLEDEVFGPILPIVPYDNIDDAIAEINAGPRPLTVYCFARSNAFKRKIQRETISGGMAVNGTVAHMVQPQIPFGGIGDSGTGAYHGYYGFERFSHMKAVHRHGFLHVLMMFGPPWGPLGKRVYRLMRTVFG